MMTTASSKTLQGKTLLRYQLFCIYIFLYIGLFIALKSEAGEDPNIVVDYSPFWAVLILGAFAAFSIMNGVYNLKNCPDAAMEIDRDVKEAVTAMRKKGIIS
mmetsp:Transcript_5384/g.6218  ORF Transcript_5384/g.6218 Transcript_5384/m.6218 type:complete len:102 (+) Transcript_5384:206-511(+)|eukprot:CAMPEP_0204638688 /NCGR_PEP_ID=MMETSP0717-20131115/40079_1 /ASSEMBLY_ACC=CAM_ASM_000666 /TAXON_ID=230516 /ORGANISM="Chaetoceros curvisetus" /LENGTH=101 /DNA_ID=CAMNT_0051658523 /DNA_START=171 /DNA_END=476 /DNA_ORIENTATION=-